MSDHSKFSANDLDVRLWIGNERLSCGSGGTYRQILPSSGEVQAEVPLAGKFEIDLAVKAASDAFPAWRDWKPRDRRDVLLRLSDLIVEHAATFQQLGVMDNGTPMSSLATVAHVAAEWFRYYAGWADKICGEVTSTPSNGAFAYTLQEPYGVIGAIVTWNGPLLGIAMKAAPALAAGNTIVIKPSEMTPFVPNLFAKLAQEAGLPPGVINVVTGGPQAGEALVRHPLVTKISFTGGPATGSRIAAACGEQFKEVVLELGGKSANLIFPDADIEQASAFATRPFVMLAGQGCALPARTLVHRSIYDQVVNAVVDRARKIEPGDPFDPTTILGPLVNEAAVKRVEAMIARATEAGTAKVAVGGKRITTAPFDRGYYFSPTVLKDVDPSSEIGQVEIFGPVISLTPFDDEEEAVALANATPYGLSAFVQTSDVGRVTRLAAKLCAGTVLFNGADNLQVDRPFGGYGSSGYGREGGRAGIEEFLRTKTVSIR